MSSSLGQFQDAFIDALQRVEPGADEWMEALTAQPGFSVYRNTVMKGCIDALRANFPTVERLVGSQWFAAAAMRHIHSSPPTIGPLLEYGDGFADFLQTFEPARELPYLADVARLDRLWIKVFAAAEQPRLALTALAGAAPDALARMRLQPCAAARWHWFALPAFTIWQCNREQRALPQPLVWREEGALLCRQGNRVDWQALSVGGYRFIEACAAGAPLGDASTLALQAQPDLDFTDLLARLFAAGVFVAAQGDPTHKGEN